MTRWLTVAIVVTLAAVTAAAQPQRAGAAFPPRLQAYLTNEVKPADADRRRLQQGEPIARLLDVEDGNEVAVFGAIWIDAPIRRYLDAVQQIETFERGGAFKLTRRISPVPRPEDFEQLRLPDEDIRDLRSCRVGACAVKLDEQTIKRVRSDVDWAAPDAPARANALMRQFALTYTAGYLEGGNQRLAVYRDADRPTVVADQLRALIAQVPDLTSDMPTLRRDLLDSPQPSTPGMASLLYWQQLEFGLRPTIRISHLMVREGKEDAVIAAKMLYASHYFWAGLELRALLADPARGDGFWLVTINRSRSDGFRGVTGFFVRRRVRNEVQARTLSSLQATKRRLEHRQ